MPTRMPRPGARAARGAALLLVALLAPGCVWAYIGVSLGASAAVGAVVLMNAPRPGDSHASRGDGLARQGKREEALAVYEEGLRLYPKNQKLQRRVARTRAQIAERKLADVDKALAARQFPEAIQLVAGAARLTPGDPTVARGRDRVIQATIAHASGLRDGGRPGAGWWHLALLVKGLGEGAGVAIAEEARARTAWAGALRAAAAAAEKGGRPGEALLRWAALARLTGDADAARRAADAELGILQAHRLRVRLEGNADVAALLRAWETAADAVPIAVQAPGSKAREAPDLVLTVRLGPIEPGGDEASRTESRRYQSGVQHVPNPRRNDIEREIAGLQRELADLDEDYARESERAAREQKSCDASGGGIGNCDQARYAREEMQRLSERRASTQERIADTHGRLANEPTMLEEPAYASYDYEVRTVRTWLTRDASAVGKWRDGERPLQWSERIEAVASDEAHAAHRRINLAANPLTLPDRRELEATLAARCQDALRQVVEGAYEARRRLLLEQARAARGPARLELLCVHAAMRPDRVDPAIAAEIDELADVPEAVDALLAPAKAALGTRGDR